MRITLLLILCIGAAWTQAPGPSDEQLGPDVVMLKELVHDYDPVPFNHRAHAQMTMMWGGCVTCHHRPPEVQNPPPEVSATQPVARMENPTQDDAAAVPACKSCHRIEMDNPSIRMPNLKGAYHRQCLSCHREWMHSNSCLICHTARNADAPPPIDPTPDDIVGRMHPPITAPDTKVFQTRFTPTAGANVTFRHAEHAGAFGIRCVACHRQDNCSHCHDPAAAEASASAKPLKPGKTWKDSHGPCMGCHLTDRCATCHYKDDQEPPPAFRHAAASTQDLDEPHAKIACSACHPRLDFQAQLVCGNEKCHPVEKAIAYPTHKPGPVAATQPASDVTPQTQPSDAQVADRPVIRYIRR